MNNELIKQYVELLNKALTEEDIEGQGKNRKIELEILWSKMTKEEQKETAKQIEQNSKNII